MFTDGLKRTYHDKWMVAKKTTNGAGVEWRLNLLTKKIGSRVAKLQHCGKTCTAMTAEIAGFGKLTSVLDFLIEKNSIWPTSTVALTKS